MALTYEESAALMKDPTFVSRVKVACLKFADYITNEASTTPAHMSRIKWAQYAMTNPDTTAGQVTPPTVMDNQVQTDGSTITDANLQTAVESTINKLI